MRLDLAGQSISVIDEAEIKAIQGADLTRVVERLPGVTFARNGGLGSTTSLFVRGANSEQLVVLVDGVRMADTAAPSGGFDFGNLEAGGIAKLELLRGSNSVPWGSDAIGGVLAVTTRAYDGIEASAEYGAHDTLSLSGGAGIERSGYALSINGGYTRSDGISAAAAGTEPDPYRQWRIGGKARVDLTDNFSLNASARHSDGRVAFDSFLFVDDGEYQTARIDSGRAGFDYRGDVLTLSGGIGLSNTARAYFDPAFDTAPSFETQGRDVHADIKGTLRPAEGLTLDFGGDGDWSRFSTTFDPRQTARLLGAHALVTWQGRGVLLSAGLRHDDHDRFGGKWTFGANGALNLGEVWRVRASYGEGFKAPTLYQLYGYGGNALLRPETSRSFELGIERGDRNGYGLHMAATLFRRDATDLIDYRFPTGYRNIARTRAQGFEAELGARLSETLSARAAYTYLEAINRDSGRDLARRPRHALSASLDWTTPLAGLVLGGDLRLVGDSFDDAFNTVPLDGYALATVRARLPIGDHFELYGRIENLTDARYETAAGYGTYGRSAYAGVRVAW
ncbi:MAG: TonB-dependent receptor plug domain-containing protein [Novosphingobium sp.]